MDGHIRHIFLSNWFCKWDIKLRAERSLFLPALISGYAKYTTSPGALAFSTGQVSIKMWAESDIRWWHAIQRSLDAILSIHYFLSKNDGPNSGYIILQMMDPTLGTSLLRVYTLGIYFYIPVLDGLGRYASYAALVRSTPIDCVFISFFWQNMIHSGLQ